MSSLINNIVSARDVLSSNSPMHNIGKFSALAENAFNKVSTGEKYDSRAELDKQTGAGREHDSARAQMLNAKICENKITTVKIKLNAQQQAMERLSDAMLNFRNELKQNNSVVGSDAEKADKVLTAIEEILHSKNINGEYIFGGNDPFTDPLSVIDSQGRKIQIHLTEQTNVRNGTIAENNYSISAQDGSKISVSSMHEVRANYLYPGMDAVVNAICFANMIKTGEVAAAPGIPGVSLEDITAAQLAQEEAISGALVAINTEIEKLDAAHKVNQGDIIEAEERSSLFEGDVEENIAIYQKYRQSAIAAASANQATNNLKEKLMQIIQ